MKKGHLARRVSVILHLLQDSTLMYKCDTTDVHLAVKNKIPKGEQKCACLACWIGRLLRAVEKSSLAPRSAVSIPFRCHSQFSLDKCTNDQ